MKRILLIFALMLSIIPSLSFGASDNVYVIEISGEVNPGMLNYVRENIEDANNKKFDALLIYRVDRLGRSTLVILNAVAHLEELGVDVRSMTELFDSSHIVI